MLCAQDVCEVGLSCGCDEELWPDLTGWVDTLSQGEDSSVDGILHGGDLALAVAECEVVVEEPAAELVGSLVLVSLRQNLAEGAGCEVSFCCFDGSSEGCDRALGFDFCFCFGACCSFLFEGGEEADSHVGVGDDGVDGGWCGVHAVLADGGEDFAGDLAAELCSFRLVAADDDFVETCLVDGPCLLYLSPSIRDGVCLT